MAVSDSTYYGFTRVREMSPEVQDWASIDLNWEIVSKVLNFQANHQHTGSSGITYPGYNAGDPPNPTVPTLTERTTDGGILQAGTSIGVRLSYVDINGLETDAAPEQIIELAAAADRPDAPYVDDPATEIVAAADAIPGGTYIYAMTKGKGSGETEMSDIVTVEIPYDQTYSVLLTWDDDIDSYSDGTDKLYIYRSAGLNTEFELVKTVTTTSQLTYTDDNTIEATNIQPPGSNTFDADKSVRTDVTPLEPHPADASLLRIYVTQNPRLWGTEHLLFEQDLSGSPPSTYDYLGNEVFDSGWPKEISQITNNPGLIDLTTEADGGVQATADSDFDGNKLANLRLGDAPTVTKANGFIWHDDGTDTIQAHLDGSDVTLAQAGASYAHPAESSGGHIADNIPFKASSGVSAKDIFDMFLDTNGARDQQQTMWVAFGSGATNTSSATLVAITNMTATLTQPTALEFDNQWVDIVFQSELSSDTPDVDVTCAIEINSVTEDDSTRVFTAPSSANKSFTATIHHAVQLADTGTTYTIKALWSTSGGTLTAVSTHRMLRVKRVF